MDNDTLSSFPSTPRTSQDGSRPNTPMTNNGNHGSNNKGLGDRSRSGSPDVEIMLESDELGIKPLVGLYAQNLIHDIRENGLDFYFPVCLIWRYQIDQNHHVIWCFHRTKENRTIINI
jgi:hypothetical protein